MSGQIQSGCRAILVKAPPHRIDDIGKEVIVRAPFDFKNNRKNRCKGCLNISTFWAIDFVNEKGDGFACECALRRIDDYDGTEEDKIVYKTNLDWEKHKSKVIPSI